MHKIQNKILSLLKHRDGVFREFSYRTLGEVIHVDHAQQVKHHLVQLERRGLLIIDTASKILRLTSLGSQRGSALVTVPIIGTANCGRATMFAEENLEGTFMISKRLISNRERNIFAIRAAGSSMNRANIGGVSIDNEDYVIVDGSPFKPRNGDYVLAIIEGFGVVKKLLRGKRPNELELISESTDDYLPIHIHQDDQRFIINGKVIYVVKKSKSIN